MLTDSECKNATCPPGKKRERFTDVGSLYLEVSPAGSKRWFWKTYADGKEGRMALGIAARHCLWSNVASWRDRQR